MAAVLKGESVKLTVLKGISAYSMADRQPEIMVNSSFGIIVNKLFHFYADSLAKSRNSDKIHTRHCTKFETKVEITIFQIKGAVNESGYELTVNCNILINKNKMQQ